MTALLLTMAGFGSTMPALAEEMAAEAMVSIDGQRVIASCHSHTRFTLKICNLEDYTGGEELSLSKSQMSEIRSAMTPVSSSMYRVEDGSRTATGLKAGDSFNFAQLVYESKDTKGGALRSFTKSAKDIPELEGQVDDAVIFRTVGATKQDK